MTNTVDNPFFARLWTLLSTHETDAIRRLRRENLAGLSGRVLEVGAGTGTNFEFYPDTVTEVVAVEPEHRLVELAREGGRGGAGTGHRHRRHRRAVPGVRSRAVRRRGVLAGAVLRR